MLNDDVDLRIANMARQLRLGNQIVKLYKELEFTTPAEFTSGLLEGLVASRKRERANRYRHQAGFERIKLLENYDFENLYLPKGYSLEWLKSCQFIKEKQNLILLGNPGTGKTHLATALGVKACEMGLKPCYRRTSKFIEELTRYHENNRMAEFWRRFDGKDLLILDEWGYVPVHLNGTRLLFDVIADCYEKRSVILTTNLPVQEWNKTFNDERLILAMIDRLAHHGLIIKHTGESYRLKHALMR